MDAIVFTSNSGFTEQYANLLANETGLPVYSLKSAKGKLKEGSKIIYLGWIMASQIKGLSNAQKMYNVQAACGVGMGAGDAQLSDMIKANSLSDTPAFILQGGFDINKLHGIYKLMMKAMRGALGKKLADKPDKTPGDMDMLDLLKNGGSRVKKDNLSPLLLWLSNNQ